MVDKIIDVSEDFRRELDEAAAGVLWCFLMEQALLIQASGHDADPGWSHVCTYLLGMLRKGPKDPGLIEMLRSSSALAAELNAGELDWEGMVEDLEGTWKLHVLEDG